VRLGGATAYPAHPLDPPMGATLMASCYALVRYQITMDVPAHRSNILRSRMNITIIEILRSSFKNIILYIIWLDIKLIW